MVTQNDFEKSINYFTDNFCKNKFYELAIELVKIPKINHGALLVLSTWNMPYSRFVLNDFFDFDEFSAVINSLDFKSFEKQDIRNIELDKFEDEINKKYKSLYLLKSVKHTGASKILHILCPNVFIPWDSYIRGEKKGTSLKYDKNKDYVKFLKDMQLKFKDVNLNNNKTFAKLIDEYNYVNFTKQIKL